jgi:hypothetical protein
MRINEVTESRVDELDSQQAGQAVAKGAKAVGGAVKGFAKGFKDEFMGKTSAPAAGAAQKTAPTKKQPMPGKKQPAASSMNINSLKKSIASLNPKQQQALRTQAAKLAGA